MRTIELGKSGLKVPVVALGCMRLGGIAQAEAEELIGGALSLGANFFDHADIYGGGTCEEIFGKCLRNLSIRREDVILQSKCCMQHHLGMYNLSKEHILEAVDGILSRLGTDYLDTLLLHAYDTLVEPEEVAEAFCALHACGKVRFFGVSNMNAMQIELLQSCLPQALVANQLQFSLTNAALITAGYAVNKWDDFAYDRTGDALDYCRLKRITIQPWSPFQHGIFQGSFVGDREKFSALNLALDELSEKYSATPTAIALAWILRHPAKMQPIVGTMHLARLRECVRATEIQLERADWYKLYNAAGYPIY